MNSNTALIRKGGANVPSSKRLPWVGLLALAMAGFICILTEGLPAGFTAANCTGSWGHRSSCRTIGHSLCGRISSGRHSFDNGYPRVEAPAASAAVHHRLSCI